MLAMMFLAFMSIHVLPLPTVLPDMIENARTDPNYSLALVTTSGCLLADIDQGDAIRTYSSKPP
jgi:hypothetical protein